MIKRGTIVEHYKGGKYIVEGIVHPSSEKITEDAALIEATHTELGEEIMILAVDFDRETIYFSDSEDNYLVLYKPIHSPKLYARPLDNFFEHVEKEGMYPVKRFKIEKPSVKQYRKKPVEVQAMVWNGTSLSSAIEFCGRENLVITGRYPGNLKIKSSGGELSADIGDYIIKDSDGRVYPCKPDLFKSHYDEVGEIDGK